VPPLQVIGATCAFSNGPGGAQQATSFQYLDVAANLIWGTMSGDAKLIKVFTMNAGSPAAEDLFVCRVKNSDGSYSAGALPALPALPAELPGAVPPRN
jgi:hypothetical protein